MARPKGDLLFTEERKKEILVAAFEVFSDKGFRGGSLSHVAELVGISDAGILHHFKSKSNLLKAVLEYRDALSREVAHITPSMSGLDFVESWFNLIKFNSSNPGIVELYCIVSAEATAEDHPAHEFFINRYEDVLSITKMASLDLNDRGLFREGTDPLAFSRGLIALSDGLQVQWLLNREWDMVEEHKNFFRTNLNETGIKETRLESL
jgi:AcrR family transcriptional regulator